MANANVVRIGQINQLGAVDALFLKVFAGEILTAYAQSITMDSTRHWQRTISYGKSAQFPALGRIGSGYHTPGAEILGQNVNHAELICPIDGMLYTDAFFDQVDELMNHYDVRGAYSEEMGQELAKQNDINIMIEGLIGARATATVNGLPGGTEIKSDLFKVAVAPGAASVAAKVAALCAALFQAARIMDENDAPKQGRFCILRPLDYYDLVQAVQTNGFSVLHKDYGGEGSYAQGKVMMIAGIEILSSNNLPYTDLSLRPYHAADCTQTIGLIATGKAIASLTLLGLGMEAGWDMRRQGTLMIAKMVSGFKYLRPESLIELKLDTLTV